MSHNHDDCRYCGELGGLLLGYCDDGEGYCPAPDCKVVGHCDCNCHSGKDCGCGFSWLRMPKCTCGSAGPEFVPAGHYEDCPQNGFDNHGT